MNVAERAEISAICTPIVKNIAQSICRKRGVPADQLDDAIQAGHLAVLRSLETYDPAGGWDPVGWAKLAIVREIQRELDRMRSCGDTSLDTRFDMHDHENGDDGHHGGEPLGPLTNDLNLEFESEYLRGEIIAAIMELPAPMDALLLPLLVGKSVSESGRDLGLTQSSADRLYQKAVDELKRKLNP